MSAENPPSPSTLDRALSAQAGVTAGTMPVRVIRAEAASAAGCGRSGGGRSALEFSTAPSGDGVGARFVRNDHAKPGDDEWLRAADSCSAKGWSTSLRHRSGRIEHPQAQCGERAPASERTVELQAHPVASRRARAAGLRYHGLDAAIARAAPRASPRGKASICSILFRSSRSYAARAARFGDTGGIHASALFDLQGTLVASRGCGAP